MKIVKVRHVTGAEAVQVDPHDYDSLNEIVEWTNGAALDGKDFLVWVPSCDGHSGYAGPGDWIVKDRLGFRVYTPLTFVNTFEEY